MKAEVDDSQREALCEWARANGLDPATIDEHVQVVNGTTIRYRQLVEAAVGQVAWEERSTPLLVPFRPPGVVSACP